MLFAYTYTFVFVSLPLGTQLFRLDKVTGALGSALAFVGLKNEVKEREDLGRETQTPRKTERQQKFFCWNPLWLFARVVVSNIFGDFYIRNYPIWVRFFRVTT